MEIYLGGLKMHGFPQGTFKMGQRKREYVKDRPNGKG